MFNAIAKMTVIGLILVLTLIIHGSGKTPATLGEAGALAYPLPSASLVTETDFPAIKSPENLP